MGGTGDLTFTVTWQSRIWRETDRLLPRVVSRRDDCFKSFIVLPHIAELSVMRYNVRLARSDVKGRPQDVVVDGRENTKSCVTTPDSTTCVIQPDEPVWSFIHRLST